MGLEMGRGRQLAAEYGGTLVYTATGTADVAGGNRQ